MRLDPLRRLAGPAIGRLVRPAGSTVGQDTHSIHRGAQPAETFRPNRRTRGQRLATAPVHAIPARERRDRAAQVAEARDADRLEAPPPCAERGGRTIEPRDRRLAGARVRIAHHGSIEIGAASAVRPNAEQDRIDARIPKDRIGDLRHGDRGPVTFHRRPRVDGVVHPAREGVHRPQAGPGGGRKPRHLDSELIRVVGGDHPGAARGADRRDPSRRSRGAHQRIRGSEIDEVDELAGRNDPGLCEQPAGDPARNREIRGMRSARIRPRLGPSDQCRHHGLATRHGPGRAQQPRSLRKPFQVQRDHRGSRVLDEVLEHVGRPHVAGVAEGGHRAHPETGSFHELVEQAGHVDSALSDDADAALAHPRQVDERREEAVAGVDEPAAVRTPHRNAGFTGALHHARLKRLALLARFGETRRGHQHRGDAPGDRPSSPIPASSTKAPPSPFAQKPRSSS